MLLNIISYSVFTGFAFASLCAITRVGRGWGWQLVGLGAMAGIDLVMQLVWDIGLLPLDQWLAIIFACSIGLFSLLVLSLSRDSIGRRAFLAITYGMYATSYAAIFHLVTYRDLFELHEGARTVLGLGMLALVAVMNLVFIRRILPLLPRDLPGANWCEPCLVAGGTLVVMFTSGIWPVSLVSASAGHCVPFAVSFVAAWVAFPLLCRAMSERLRTMAAERSLALMTTEVEVRRAGIEEARRIAHDRRHDHVVIADFLLRGNTKAAMAYLNTFARDGEELSAATHIWCENDTVNAILAGYGRKAAAKGVGFAAEARVGGRQPLPDIELVAMIANLIENAIDGVKGEGEGVEVSILQHAHGLGIRVANPVAADFALSAAGLPCEEPGIGLESVRRVIERHNGVWNYELKDGILTCQVALMFGHGVKGEG